MPDESRMTEEPTASAECPICGLDTPHGTHAYYRNDPVWHSETGGGGFYTAEIWERRDDLIYENHVATANGRTERECVVRANAFLRFLNGATRRKEKKILSTLDTLRRDLADAKRREDAAIAREVRSNGAGAAHHERWEQESSRALRAEALATRLRGERDAMAELLREVKRAGCLFSGSPLEVKIDALLKRVVG